MVKLANSLSRLERSKILVMGDLLLDTYTIGKASRISPEAPVAVVHVNKEIHLPGGAGNTALNLKSLGAQVVLIGRIGRDYAGDQLKNSLEKENISTAWLLSQEHYPTPIKNRIIAENQQIVRVDHEQIMPLSESIEQLLIDSFPELMQDIKVVALSDYGKGFLTPTLLHAFFEYTNAHGITVVTDPKGSDFSKYKGTTIIKPNQSEAYAAANLPYGSSLDLAAQRILENTQARMLMITRSEAGISLFYSSGKRQDFPVQVKEVKDVTGAGDTVLAMLAYALANHLTDEETAELCNVAAGIAIEHLGCARITLTDLAHRLLEKNIDHKIFDQEQLFVLQEVLKVTPYNILVIDKLNFFSPALFNALQSLAHLQFVLLVYLTDAQPCEISLKMLASLKEVNFILIHSDQLKDACRQLQPNLVYHFTNNQLHPASEFIALLQNLEKNSHTLIV